MGKIVSIFKSGYWKRLWVVQELVSSHSAVIRWGDAEISWTLLGLATTLIRNNQSLISIFTRVEASGESTSPFGRSINARTGLMNAYLMYRMPSAEFRGDSMSFLDLLRLTRRFDVSERLDRIYAILGLPSQHTGPDASIYPQTITYYQKGYTAASSTGFSILTRIPYRSSLLSVTQHCFTLTIRHGYHSGM